MEIPLPLKDQMIVYLKGCPIDNATALWAYAKNWAKLNGFEMGGGYASIGTYINIVLLKDDVQTRFTIDLSELKLIE